MATLARTLVCEPPVPQPDPATVESGVDRALAALRRLVGADRVDLLAHNTVEDAFEVVAGSGIGSGGTISPGLHDILGTSAFFFLGDAEPRWIDQSEGRQGKTLSIKILEQPTRRLFLLIGFDRDPLILRPMLLRELADLILLLKPLLELEAEANDAEDRRAAAAEALDHGECGVIAVRADHSVVYANASATAQLAAERGLRLRRGVLRPTERTDAIRFEAALDAVIDMPPGKLSGRRRANVMLLSNQGDRPTILVIAPTAAWNESNRSASGAAAIISVIQAVQTSVSGLDTLCHLHGLSRVESRLIANLLRGLTLSDAAAEMRVKTETVRAYLKQIFAKTGTHRQTELLALMTRYLRAMRGDFDFQPA